MRHSEFAVAHLRARVEAAGGWLSFEQWMSHALYAPGLGYYAAGNIKFPTAGSSGMPQGDFVTAPELTPMFAQTLAEQVAEVLEQTRLAGHAPRILEFGAGTGALAADTLSALDTLGIPVQYFILEVSDDLTAVQQRRLAPFGDRVQWLSALPTTFSGCVLANEVMDAMPVTTFTFGPNGEMLERGVSWDATENRFVWRDRPADAALIAVVKDRVPAMPGYTSEINLQAEAWIRSMSSWLSLGAALLIDYGFPQSEYYHPQRAGGTLMAHLRHHAHDDVLAVPGIQDITAHVDFTAMAQAALDSGLDLLGYTSQARFLLNAGIARHLGSSTDPAAQMAAFGAFNKLTSEAEMGELFKVLAIGRGINAPLSGFALRDRRHLL